MGLLSDIVSIFTGGNQADAAREGAALQIEAGKEASALLDPFQGIGQQGLDLSGFLTDPNQQFQFLQNNPIFQASLDNANNQTNRMAAARGRLSSGDTLMDLSNNFLTSAYPLISDHKNSIGNLLNFGLNTAQSQGNLRIGQGNAAASGVIGAQNARSSGAQNLINLTGSILGSGAGQAGLSKLTSSFFGGGG